MLKTGLNPYGLTYTLGLQGVGTPRANPNGRGLGGFIEIGAKLGVRTLELHNGWLAGMSEVELKDIGKRLRDLGMTPVISLGPPLEGVDTALRAAMSVRATVVRLGLTPVLCGARAEEGARWAGLVLHARTTLRKYAPEAAAEGLTFAIENHQDFGSAELVEFCADAGPGVGICLDTGNPLAVGEDCISFARRVAPLVCHVHLKDYNAQWTDDGYRLVRCAIGDGAVPFREIAAILAEHHETLTSSLEPGALEARHIRLFRPEWWQGYAARTAAELGPCLANARVRKLDDGAEWRTPWERGEDAAAIERYELEMIERSAANMRALGLMESGAA
jgi:sugar phosphate isomerase/epimerase